MQLTYNSNPVKIVYQRPDKQETEFKWSDINPFKKSQWKGNLTEANKGFASSWKSFGKNMHSFVDMAKKDFAEDRKKYGFARAVLNNSLQFSGLGALFNPKRTLKYTGALSRAGMDVLGGTLGYAGQFVMPKKWEKAIAENADWIDPSQWATTAVSLGDALVHLDRSRIKIPGEEDNGGLMNDTYWSWLGDKSMRQDISDTANFAAAIYGVKGLKGGIKGMTKGQGIAGLDNLRMAKKALTSTGEIISDWATPSKWTLAGTGKNAFKAATIGLDASAATIPQFGLLNSPFSRGISFVNNSDFNINKNKYKKIIW